MDVLFPDRIAYDAIVKLKENIKNGYSDFISDMEV
jgi:hypothetical protein